MSDRSNRRHSAGPGHSRRQRERPGGRRRLIKRIALATAGTMVAIVVVAAAGGYFLANHLLSGIHRIPDIVALDAADQPVMPAATRRSMTILLTSDGRAPASTRGHGALGSSTRPEGPSGLIALVHLNAAGHAGAVVSIPADAVVTIPGHGQAELWRALPLGGPSLLIRSVERLTDVRIDHYSVLSLPGAVNVVDALNGVDVDVPYATTSLGYPFHRGIDHLQGRDVLPYVRQPHVTEVGRMLLQQNLIRTMLAKIANRHLLSSPSTDYRVVHALSGALSVDSNFTNSEIERLALRLGYLDRKDGTFVSAPTRGALKSDSLTAPAHLRKVLDGKLWSAIRHDAVGAYARRYPFTVTPGAPG